MDFFALQYYIDVRNRAFFESAFCRAQPKSVGEIHMDSSVCLSHTVRVHNFGKSDEPSCRKAGERTAAHHDL